MMLESQVQNCVETHHFSIDLRRAVSSCWIEWCGEEREGGGAQREDGNIQWRTYNWDAKHLGLFYEKIGEILKLNKCDTHFIDFLQLSSTAHRSSPSSREPTVTENWDKNRSRIALSQIRVKLLFATLWESISIVVSCSQSFDIFHLFAVWMKTARPRWTHK